MKASGIGQPVGEMWKVTRLPWSVPEVVELADRLKIGKEFLRHLPEVQQNVEKAKQISITLNTAMVTRWPTCLVTVWSLSLRIQ